MHRAGGCSTAYLRNEVANKIENVTKQQCTLGQACRAKLMLHNLSATPNDERVFVDLRQMHTGLVEVNAADSCCAAGALGCACVTAS